MPKVTKTLLKQLAGAPALPAAQRKLLLEAASRLASADQVNVELAARNRELTRTEAQVTRFREHAEALGAHGKQLVGRLLDAEDRSTRLRNGIAQLEARRASLGRQALATLERLGT
jgi:septal ring factor EnvC (AmiA/AmiB activator)